MIAYATRWSVPAWLRRMLVVAAVATPIGVLAATAPGIDVGQAVIVVRLVHGSLEGAERQLTINDNVFSEEVIETGDQSATRIVFRDGTELSLGPASRVILDRYVYDPQGGTGQMALRLMSGVFEFASGSLDKSSYDIRTPFANLAIRGTRFGGYLPFQTLMVSEGVVEARYADGTVYTIGPASCLRPRGSGQAEVVSVENCAGAFVAFSQMVAMLDAAIEPGAGPEQTSPPPLQDRATTEFLKLPTPERIQAASPS